MEWMGIAHSVADILPIALNAILYDSAWKELSQNKTNLLPGGEEFGSPSG
jgi:hypothetical protein